MPAKAMAALAAISLTAACATATMGGPMSDGGLKTFGGFVGPESASYDAATDSYLIGDAGGFGPGNDGFIARMAPDGSILDLKWVEGSDENPLGNALGTAIHAGAIYVCDGDTVRMFDLATAAQTGHVTIEGATFLNDLAVAEDGTFYVSNTGQGEQAIVYRVTPGGAVSEFLHGDAIAQPNGVDMDADGNVVLVGLGFAGIKVFSPADGSLVASYDLPESGIDGIITLADSFIVSATTSGTIYELDKATGAVTTLAEDIPSAASITYDPKRNRIVIPQLRANQVTFLEH